MAPEQVVAKGLRDYKLDEEMYSKATRSLDIERLGRSRVSFRVWR